MQAVILAAGKGTRLRPLTDTTPKPMIKIGDKPILAYVIETLPNEIDEVILVVGYLEEQIREFFKNEYFNKKITYAPQREMLGTYGALLSAKPFIKNEKYLVLGSDDIQDKSFLKNCIENDRVIGLAERPSPGDKFFTIETDENNNAKGMRRPTEQELAGNIRVATGVYVLDNNFWELLPVASSGMEYGIPQTLFSSIDKYQTKAVMTNFWIPINTFEDLEKARVRLTKPGL